jgi:dCMP deaminase
MKQSQIDKYCIIVRTLALFSKSDRLKVGAIVLKSGRIISTGYNGQLPKTPHKKIMVDNHDVSTIHAEQNCFMHCAKNGISTDGCELFVTHFPCQHCTKLAIMAGIKKIYYIEDYRNDENPFSKYIKIQQVRKK